MTWSGSDNLTDAFNLAVFNIGRKVVNDNLINSFNSNYNTQVDNNDSRISYTYIGNQIYVTVLPSRNDSDIDNVQEDVVPDLNMNYDNTVTRNYDEVTDNDLNSLLTTTTEIIQDNNSLDGLINDLKSQTNTNNLIESTYFKSKVSNGNNSSSDYNIKTFSIDKPRNYDKDYYGVSKTTSYLSDTTYYATVTNYINGVKYDKHTYTSSLYVEVQRKVKTNIDFFNRHVELQNKLSLVDIQDKPDDLRQPTVCCIDAILYPDLYYLVE